MGQKRSQETTQPATAERRVFADWDLVPYGAHRSKDTHVQPKGCARVPGCAALGLPLAWGLYPGDNHRRPPVKGIWKGLRQTYKLFLASTERQVSQILGRKRAEIQPAAPARPGPAGLKGVWGQRSHLAPGGPCPHPQTLEILTPAGF